MFEFTVELAEIPIKIFCENKYLLDISRDYLSDKEPFFSVALTKEDIDFENELTLKNQGRKIGYCYLESTAIYRKICNKLIEYDTFLLHSAVVQKNGGAIVFLGKSGAGKSTQAGFWVEHLNAEYINGDKPLFRLINGKIFVFGTPWSGKEGYNSNTSSEVKAMISVEKAKQNEMIKLSKYEAVPVVYAQLNIPYFSDKSDRILDIFDIIIENIPVYRLKCKKEAESAFFAYREIKKHSGEDL